jgi:uncharacterized protein (TIGR00255 family)
MTLSSMTGFARIAGVSGLYAWAWELKSVNGKGLEVRLRLPPGWDALEIPVRARTSAILSRGTIYGTLSLRRAGVTPVVRVNEPVLAAVLAAIAEISSRVKASPPTLDGILGLKGVIEVIDEEEGEGERRAVETDIVDRFGQALAELAAMRRHEGESLGRVLATRLSEMETLVHRADSAPGRRPEAIRSRLAEQIAALLDACDRFDPDRLHQEAILIAAKADIREELDRLAAHIGQARGLLGQGGPIGRRLDFLAQELHRETNTLCAKSNDVGLTTIALELKSVVEQFREQVQNLE